MKKILYCLLLIGTATLSCKKEPDAAPAIPKESAVLDERVSPIIPHIFIDVAGKQEVVSKDAYLNATIRIDGMQVLPDLAEVTGQIKGRGNSTWLMPKKPYRFKLDQAASVLGLAEAKDWVLLANFQDYTLMTNAVAMKAAQQLGMPFTNTIIPVDLTVNGEYRGSYNLTQQVQVHENRINIGAGGTFLELDNLYDEPSKFKSAALQLPVMFKYPSAPSPTQFQDVQTEFNNLENLLLKGAYDEAAKLIDRQQVANYLLVYALVGSYEINHPKSLFLHKAAGGKYSIGPVWDFDWAFGYDESILRYFQYPNDPLLIPNDSRIGGKFLGSLMKDPEIKKAFKQSWQNYKAQNFDALLLFVEEYAARIRESQKKDFAIWKNGANNLPQIKADMKTYLRKRALHLDSYVKNF